MGHIALYRKYRPTTFDDVTGQRAIVKTLRNEILLDRIANAYLFCGPRGTGKTSIARIFAKAMNCQNKVNGNPCNNCPSCKGENIDVTEIDAASNNSVDSIRSLVEESGYACQNGKYRIYIIDEVHMLTGSSFNALLKTLEEPSPNVVFILATTERHKVPQTIASRCQRFDFNNIMKDDMIDRLKYICQQENITYKSDQELELICKLSEGAMRDAVSILDQCAFMGNNVLDIDEMKDLLGQVGDDVCRQVDECIKNEDVNGLMGIVEQIVYKGKPMSAFAKELYDFYKEKLTSSTEHFETYHRFMKIFGELESQAVGGMARVHMEIGLIRACKPEMDTDYDSVIQRLERLEKDKYLGSSVPDSGNKEETVKQNNPYDIMNIIGVDRTSGLFTMII